MAGKAVGKKAKDVEPVITPDKDYDARIERAFVFDVEGFDWNCPQHITPRYTAEEIEAGVAPLKACIAGYSFLAPAEPILTSARL